MSGSDRELDRMERAKNNQSGNPNEGGAPAASSLDSAAHKVHASRPENVEAPPASASSVVFSTAPRTAQEVVAQLSSGSSASARQSPKTKPRIFALGDNSPIEDQDAILSLHARTNIHAAVPVRIDFDDKLRPRGGGAGAASRAGGAVPASTTAFFLSPASSCSSSPKTEKRKYLRSPRDGGKSRDLGKSSRARDDDFASKEDSYRVYMREDRAVLGSHEDAKAMEKLGKWLVRAAGTDGSLKANSVLRDESSAGRGDAGTERDVDVSPTTSAVQTRTREGKNEESAGDACAPYKLQSEEHVKRWLTVLHKADDADGKDHTRGSDAHQKLIDSMTHLSDEEYKTLQTMLFKRLDQQTKLVLDHETVAKALDHVNSLGLPPTVMYKLRHGSDKNSRRGQYSTFVHEIVKTGKNGLRMVMDGLLDETPAGSIDDFLPDNVRDFVKGTLQPFAEEAEDVDSIADAFALLPSLPYVGPVLKNVNETAVGFLQDSDTKNIPYNAFREGLTALGNNTQFVHLLNETNHTAVAVDGGNFLDGVLKKIGDGFDKIAGKGVMKAIPGIGDAEKLVKAIPGIGDAEKLIGAGSDNVAAGSIPAGGVLKTGVGIADTLVEKAVESDSVNRNPINKQIGDAAQNMTSKMIGKGYDIMKSALQATPAGPIFNALDKLGLGEFVKQTIPKLLRLTFDHMFSDGPAWLRAMAQNMGGFSGAMKLFKDTLTLFSPKGMKKILDGLTDLFNGEFLKRSKCSFSYMHFAMPDPDDADRRREVPATTEKDWFACRERCYKLFPDCTFFSFWDKYKQCYLQNADAREARNNFEKSDWVTGTADGVVVGFRGPKLRIL
eukprot:g9754.t1